MEKIELPKLQDEQIKKTIKSWEKELKPWFKAFSLIPQCIISSYSSKYYYGIDWDYEENPDIAYEQGKVFTICLEIFPPIREGHSELDFFIVFYSNGMSCVEGIYGNDSGNHNGTVEKLKNTLSFHENLTLSWNEMYQLIYKVAESLKLPTFEK